MATADDIRRWSGSFTDFCADAIVPTSLGQVRFGDIMQPFQRELIVKLSPSLVGIANGRKPPIANFWAEFTKGCGKGLVLALAVLWLLMFARVPVHIQLAAADRDQADETNRIAKGILWCNGALASRVESQSYRLVCKDTGGEAEILSSDIAGSHGSRPTMLVLDELCHVAKWEFILNLADNASKNPNCLKLVATNAGHLDHESYKWRELARTSPRWSFHQFARPAPWLDPAELADAERRNPRERYRRLFWGEWSHGSGDALSPADLAAAVLSAGPHVERAAVAYVGGLDLGLRRDRSGFVVLAVDPLNDCVELAHAMSWSPHETGREVDLELVQAHVLQVCHRLRVDTVAFDEWQAAFLAQGLQARGVKMFPVPTGAGSQQIMAVSLIEAFKDRRIRLYPHEELIRDLGQLSIVEKAGGQFRIVALRGDDGHCDLAQALCLALPTALSWCREIALTPPEPVGPCFVFA